jgi:hypothetical protein
MSLKRLNKFYILNETKNNLHFAFRRVLIETFFGTEPRAPVSVPLLILPPPLPLFGAVLRLRHLPRCRPPLGLPPPPWPPTGLPTPSPVTTPSSSPCSRVRLQTLNSSAVRFVSHLGCLLFACLPIYYAALLRDSSEPFAGAPEAVHERLALRSLQELSSLIPAGGDAAPATARVLRVDGARSCKDVFFRLATEVRRGVVHMLGCALTCIFFSYRH